MRISDVRLWRIWVEALERAVTRYTLLSDVIKSFSFADEAKYYLVLI